MCIHSIHCTVYKRAHSYALPYHAYNIIYGDTHLYIHTLFCIGKTLFFSFCPDSISILLAILLFTLWHVTYRQYTQSLIVYLVYIVLYSCTVCIDKIVNKNGTHIHNLCHLLGHLSVIQLISFKIVWKEIDYHPVINWYVENFRRYYRTAKLVTWHIDFH